MTYWKLNNFLKELWTETHWALYLRPITQNNVKLFVERFILYHYGFHVLIKRLTAVKPACKPVLKGNSPEFPSNCVVISEHRQLSNTPATSLICTYFCKRLPACSLKWRCSHHHRKWFHLNIKHHGDATMEEFKTCLSFNSTPSVTCGETVLRFFFCWTSDWSTGQRVWEVSSKHANRLS